MRFQISDDGDAVPLNPFQNQPNLKQRIAVKISNVVKCYKCDDEDVFALNNISLDVYEGETYVLMGPSGAGKSTVLAAIMGLISIDSGKVILCGKDITNGKPSSQFVSYMPQEGMDMAMYPDFTASELLHFSGRQNGLTKNEVDRMIHFFERVMEFYQWEKPFKNLNSGQQKVVCFGSSVLHQPRVLVLDEPFIGVDYAVLPNIWKLIRILKNLETTIFIVTHDIDQASKADRVGLMARGKMIVEGRPKELLKMFGKEELEDVFLEACLMDEKAEKKETRKRLRQLKKLRAKPATSNVAEPTKQTQNMKALKKKEVNLDCGDWKDAEPNLGHCSVLSSWTTPIKALLYKNRISFKHCWLLFLAIILIPTIQNYVIMRTVGKTPKLYIGVFNYELSEEKTTCPIFNTCEEYKDSGLLSCLLMNFTASEDLEYVYFKTETEAKEAFVTRSNLNLNLGYFKDHLVRLTGYIGFNKSFTNSFIRAMDDDDLTEEELANFQVPMVFDSTEPVLNHYFYKTMYLGYFEFAEFVKEKCDYDSVVGTNIIEFEEVFKDIDFPGTYLASSALLGILWFFPIVSSAFNTITERQTGAYTRSLLAGTSPFQMLIANCVRPVAYTFLQTLVWLYFLYVFEEVTIKGEVFLLFLLSMGMGVLGEIIGFIYGLLLTNHLEATIVVLGTYVPVLMMSGIMWPIESIKPDWIQNILWCLPASLPAKAFRNISHRGYDFMDERVYLGFVSLGAWISVTFLIFLIISRRDARLRP